MLITAEYVRQFPLIPGGGLFFLPVGICIVIGAFAPHFRMPLVWIGFGLGILAIWLGAARYLTGLPPVHRYQLVFFALAIIVEVIAFRVLSPRLELLGERAALLGTLAIVGAHFLIMIPAFGLPIALLSLLCLANAGLAWKLPGYPIAAAWALDGAFKIGAGVVMWLASPAFIGRF